MSQPAVRLDALEAEVADLRTALRLVGVDIRPRQRRPRKRCMICGGPLPSPPRGGRPDRLTCSGTCRNRAWLARGARLALLEAEVADLWTGVAAVAAAGGEDAPIRVVRAEPRPARCVVCGNLLPPPAPTGRPRRMCSRVCGRAARRRRLSGLLEAPAGLRAGEAP